MANDDDQIPPQRAPYYDWSLLRKLGQGVQEALVGTAPRVEGMRAPVIPQPDPYPAITERFAARPDFETIKKDVAPAPGGFVRPGIASPRLSDPTLPADSATVGRMGGSVGRMAESQPQAVPRGLRVSNYQELPYPTTTGFQQDFPMGQLPLTHQGWARNQILNEATQRLESRIKNEREVGPSLTPDPWDRLINPVGPEIARPGLILKRPDRLTGEPGATAGEAQWLPPTARDLFEIAKREQRPMPLPNEAMPGTALDKALHEYYGTTAAGGTPGVVPGRAAVAPGPARYSNGQLVGTIATLQGNIPGFAVPRSMGGTGTPIVGGITPAAAMGLSPEMRQFLTVNPPPPPGTHERAAWDQAVAQFQIHQAARPLEERKVAAQERETAAKIKEQEEERPSKILERQEKALGLKAKTKAFEESQTPENKAEQKLLKILPHKDAASFLNTPAGVKMQEEAGWPVDPDLKIGVKLPKDKKIEDITPQQAHAMKIPMTDILASSQRTAAQADLNNILHGVPPGTSRLWRPLRLTPLPRAQAIAQAKAAATPAQRQYIDELMANEAKLQ